VQDKIQRLAAERQRKLKVWLDNFEQAAEIAPHVYRAYEVTKWESEAISEAPENVRGAIARELTPYYTNSLAALGSSLSAMPQYIASTTVSNLSAVTASATPTYAVLASFRSSNDEPTQIWANRQMSIYEVIQTSFGLVERIKKLLMSLKPAIAKEFELAEDTYQGAIGGWQDRTAAAIAMRNVLEHYKGELFDRAINRPHEQKIPWSVMADRLTIASVGSPGHQQLRTEEKTWNNLQKSLSNLAKNQSYRDKSLETVHTELVDHLHTVLSSVRI
jgi:hypothetical protein